MEQVLRALHVPYEVDERNDRELLILCPYHPDKKPSLGVRRDTEGEGMHFCFSCKSGGGLVQLVAQIQKVSFAEAEFWIELQVGSLEAPEPDLPPLVEVRQAGSGLLPAFRLPPGVIQHLKLAYWPKLAREHMERRGIDEAQTARWKLGYAVEGKLAGRIVLPLYDGSQRLASYQARDFTTLPNRPRYLTPSRERERPRIDVFFGEGFWGDRKRVVVVEGAFKALAVERAVGGNVAGLGGSDIRDAHVTKLMRFDEVIVMTDADPAGDAAAMDLIARLSDSGSSCRVRRVRLQPGEEADEVSREYLQARLA